MQKKPIATLFVNDALSFKLYRESIALKIKGKWREAGDKIVKCAEMHINLKMFIEAATLYTEAAECFIKIDKGEALNTYRLSIKVYCDIGRFDIAGMKLYPKTKQFGLMTSVQVNSSAGWPT